MIAKQFIKYTASVFGLILFTTNSYAQDASLATSSPGGTVYNIGLAIAEAGTLSEFDIRVTPFKSTTQAIPVVANGQVTFGLANAYELKMADTGTVSFQNSRINGLRIVSALYPRWYRFAPVRKQSSPATGSPPLRWWWQSLLYSGLAWSC